MVGAFKSCNLIMPSRPMNVLFLLSKSSPALILLTRCQQKPSAFSSLSLRRWALST